MNRYIVRLWQGDGRHNEYELYASSMNDAIDRAGLMFPGKAVTVVQSE